VEFLTTLLNDLSHHKDGATALRDLILAGAGLLGLVLLALRTDALRKSAKAAEKQSHLSETGQINDQYIKSIDQLGSENLTIRMGGIFGLEQVAAISNLFYKQVIDVLTSYIRSESNKSSSLDIQAIITVLGRMRRLKGTNISFDLSGSELSKYTFDGGFYYASFDNSNCSEASFYNVNCSFASFEDANCSKANFYGTNLTKADLRGIGTLEVNLDYANTNGACVVDGALGTWPYIKPNWFRDFFKRFKKERFE